MKTIEEIGTWGLKEHIIKNWMTHDAMWFFQCLETYGIGEANRLNKAAIKALAPIELGRVCDLFGIDKTRINDFDALKDIINAAFLVSKGDFMSFTYHFPRKNCLMWEWAGDDCFAYKGMKRLKVIDRYECGVLFRVLCWLDSLGIRYEVPAGLAGCLMHTAGKCSGEVRFFFP
ncbi:MAG TPA: DUF6125 family protein [Desulfomonilia bacterium]|nr:DUF6125 family protein [Desulfomonilia bacterium]